MNHNQKTLHTYEHISGTYATQNATNESVSLQRERFKSYLQKGLLYDMGCGTGRDVQAFSDMGYEVIGYDGSKAMLEVAKKQYPLQTFHLLNMLSKEWNIKQKPNGIWACASLLHFEQEDFIKVFNRLVDLLEKGGLLYFSVKIHDTLSTATINGRFFQYYTKEWLNSFLNEIEGLTILHCETNSNREDMFISYYVRKDIKG